jgi:serine/threonine protein kinase/pSer/pThr/pTyr-binding forkhead associated (FHA) protein
MMRQRTALEARLVDDARTTGAPYFPLSRPVVRIGRSAVNDLVIKKPTVSGKHAVIEQKQGGYYLIDQKSANGTRVNGARVAPNVPHELADGDEIRFDAYAFVFRLVETAPVETVQPTGETIDIGTRPPPWLDPEEDPSAPAAPPRTYSETIAIDPPATSDTEEGPTLVRQKRSHEATMDIGTRHSAPAATAGAGPGEDETPSAIGNYEVVKLLGTGGFGSVWQAKDAAGTLVAIKLLNPDALENQRAVRKFFHEAIVLSRLDHPNICRFIDFFPHGENYAIVMDFVKGVDLKTLLEKRNAPLPFAKACQIAEQALDAFHYAHQQKVLHRDIKPENIVLDPQGDARIMDFGIAKMSSAETQHTSATMLSPAYTSPERFDIKNVIDHHSDIYSLGLVFYEIFTGRHPFTATSPVEMIFSHLNTVPTPPSEIADLPEAISNAILKAIEKDPEDRFDDFAAFREAMFGSTAPAMQAGASHVGSVSFSGEYYRLGAVLLKMYSKILLKHKKKAKSFSLEQQGTKLTLTIETDDGSPIRIAKDLVKIVGAAK